MHFINENYHIKQIKSGKSCTTFLANHTWSMSHYTMPLVINALKARQRQTDTRTHIPKQFQETRCVPATGQCAPAFKNHATLRLCNCTLLWCNFQEEINIWLKICMEVLMQPELCVRRVILWPQLSNAVASQSSMIYQKVFRYST